MKLNIGSGEMKYDDYVNIDFVNLDESPIGAIKPDIVADAKSLPFKNDIFEEVHMTEVIEHIERRYTDIVLNEIWRVLKENGMFYFTFPDFIECMKGFIENQYGARWQVFHATLYGRQAHKGDYHVHAIELQDIITKLFNAGFVNVKTETVPWDYRITCYKGEKLPTYL